MTSPTTAQQKALAYAPTIFAIISFFASFYVVYYLAWKERQKLERLYHRLVLAMNFALLLYSLINAFGRFAVPEGTPYYPEAVGTIQSCTAIGFLNMVFAMTVPTYYGSLSLQAFMGIKNNFKEEKYRWIEKWVHLMAYCFPCAIASVIAATGNFNPAISGIGCRPERFPWGCTTDPDVTCRGKDIRNFMNILGFILIFYYFVFPPAIVASMYCWIGRMHKTQQPGVGMQQIRETARRKMMRRIANQISLYLLSFWSTWAFQLISQFYKIITDEIVYGLVIFAHCMMAAQGLIFGVVYFMLERLGKPKLDVIRSALPRRKRSDITVNDIRSNVENRDESADTGEDERSIGPFNIFDGIPAEDSPWAKYLYDDDCDSESKDREVETPGNDEIGMEPKVGGNANE